VGFERGGAYLRNTFGGGGYVAGLPLTSILRTFSGQS